MGGAYLLDELRIPFRQLRHVSAELLDHALAPTTKATSAFLTRKPPPDSRRRVTPRGYVHNYSIS
eukprot:2189544-Pyramimonas_sp.AAC.1